MPFSTSTRSSNIGLWYPPSTSRGVQPNIQVSTSSSRYLHENLYLGRPIRHNPSTSLQVQLTSSLYLWLRHIRGTTICNLSMLLKVGCALTVVAILYKVSGTCRAPVTGVCAPSFGFGRPIVVLRQIQALDQTRVDLDHACLAHPCTLERGIGGNGRESSQR